MSVDKRQRGDTHWTRRRLRAGLPAGNLNKLRICAACGARVLSRKQWLTEKCPKFVGGKSGHLISAPGHLR